MVAGLAAFQSGAHAEALAHFDRALLAEGDAAPAALHFDRASSLFALGRFEQAEAAFVQVGALAPVPLSTLATLNAGFCALEMGARARATQHLQRARELDAERELAEHISELERELDTVPTTAQDSAPESGSAQRNASTASTGQSTAAGLKPVGLARAGEGLGAALSLGAGFDSNATQSGLNQSGVATTLDQPSLPSPFGHGSASLFVGLAPNDALFLLAQYDVEQLAYSRGELDLYCAQDHSLELALEQHLPLGLRIGAAARGLLSFAGLSGWQRLGAGYGGELSVTAAHGERFETALSTNLFRTEISDATYSYLSGTRLEVALAERYRASALRADLTARYRDERLGSQDLVADPPSSFCLACQATYSLPLSYRAARIGLELAHPLFEWLRLSARASIEWRFHTGDARLDVVRLLLTNTPWRAREHQRRVGAGVDVVAYLPLGLGLDLRYDCTIAETNLDDAGALLGPPNRDFVRHQVELSVTIDF